MQQHGLDIDEPWSGSSSPISRLPGCKLTKPPRSSHGYTWPTDTQLGASGSQQPLARSASQTVRGLSRATTAQLRLGRLALNGVEGFKSCCAATNSPPVPEQAGAAESIQTKWTPTLLCYSSSKPLARQFWAWAMLLLPFVRTLRTATTPKAEHREARGMLLTVDWRLP